IGAQEVRVDGPMRSIAAELRSHRQLPQVWYQINQARLTAVCFDLVPAARKLSQLVQRIYRRCGVSDLPEPEVFDDPDGDLSPEEFHTPGQKSIADISRCTGLPATSQMKTIVVVADGQPVLALLRGDHQLDEEKLTWFIDASSVHPATGEEIRACFGAGA